MRNGYKTDQDAGYNRGGESKQDDDPAEVDFCCAWNLVQTNCSKRTQNSSAKNKSGCATCNSEDYTLHEKRSCDLQARTAQSKLRRDLFPANVGAGESEIRDVHAADEQYECGARP